MATAEGPVMALISKRLRCLRKKQTRIIGMEESICQGKTLNKDQEEILRSKPIITALIDELVNLRLPPPPPSTAGSEETSLPATKNKKKKEKAEAKNVTAIEEDCKVADDGLNSDEVSEDSTSPSNGTSEGVTPSVSRKARRKRNAKKPQTTTN